MHVNLDLVMELIIFHQNGMTLTVPAVTTYLLLNVHSLRSLVVAALIQILMMLLSTAVRFRINNYYTCLVHYYFLDSTRIWNSSPFPGMIRLQEGNYSNEGRVEVYCNGQWGTICSTGFDSTDANTICKQLGYDSYSSYSVL